MSFGQIHTTDFYPMQQMSSSELRVFMALLFFSSKPRIEKGYFVRRCFPHQRTLANITGLSEKTVNRAVKKLRGIKLHPGIEDSETLLSVQRRVSTTAIYTIRTKNPLQNGQHEVHLRTDKSGSQNGQHEVHLGTDKKPPQNGQHGVCSKLTKEQTTINNTNKKKGIDFTLLLRGES